MLDKFVAVVDRLAVVVVQVATLSFVVQGASQPFVAVVVAVVVVFDVDRLVVVVQEATS